MMTGLFALSWTPVLLLTLLAIVFGQSALALSVWGLVWALVMAKGFFDTSLTVGLMSALDGVFTTLPLMLVILGGILFSSLLTETGSLARIMAWFRRGAGDGLGRNLLITFGVGNFMEGTGVIAEPVVPPPGLRHCPLSDMPGSCPWKWPASSSRCCPWSPDCL
jgi:lactate permease